MRSESEILADLMKLCVAPGYVHAIAYLCFRDNHVIFSGEMKSEDMRHLFADSRLIRTEIMTLIGFLIKKEINYTLPAPETLSAYAEKSEALLQELHDSMLAPMLASLDPTKATGQNFNPFDSGEALREPIFYGGESAYVFQYREFALKKYANDDEWLKKYKQFSIEEARNVVHIISRLQDKKVMATFRALKDKSREEWTMFPGFVFSDREVADEGKLNMHLVQQVLNAFTLSADEKNEGFNSLNDFNAANAFPLLRKEPGEFVLFHQYSLVEALYEAPYYWMGADKDYEPILMRNRGRFTEDFSRERLEHVFGKDQVIANVEIVDPRGNRAGEIDVLVVFGNRAILLQAKSKRLTLEARRGNDGQIRDDFKQSIQDSYDQGYKCAKFLTDVSYRLTRAGVELPIKRDFKEIYIFCVVCDHYPALAFQARQFLKCKTDDVIQPPFIMDIFTLDAMTEMLESPLRLLSYVSQRTKYSNKLISPHELTILSYHLKQNLWLEGKHDLVVLHDDISADLDVAMAVRRDNVPGKRTPEGILTRFTSTVLGHLVQQIEAKPDPVTIELGFMLLTLSEDAVIDTSEGIEKIATQARKDAKHHDLTVASSAGRTGLTVHCNSDPFPTAGVRLQDHCRRRKYTEKADTWFGICIFPNKELRFGVSLDFKWEHNANMETRVDLMKKAKPIRDVLASDVKRRKIGRNDPCSCGSGKKYKKCCLR
jgi:hypothetical protein